MTALFQVKKKELVEKIKKETKKARIKPLFAGRVPA